MRYLLILRQLQTAAAVAAAASGGGIAALLLPGCTTSLHHIGILSANWCPELLVHCKRHTKAGSAGMQHPQNHKHSAESNSTVTEFVTGPTCSTSNTFASQMHTLQIAARTDHDTYLPLLLLTSTCCCQCCCSCIATAGYTNTITGPARPSQACCGSLLLLSLLFAELQGCRCWCC